MSYLKARPSDVSGALAGHAITPARPAGAASSPPWQRRLARHLLASLGHPPIKLALDAGPTLASPDEPAVATVRFRSRAALLRTLLHPCAALGDAYAAGRLDIEGDLAALLEAVYRARRTTQPWPQRLAGQPLDSCSRLVASAPRRLRRRYELDELFYRLWLDEQMLDTCAYFTEPGSTLEAAQIAQMDRICRKLRLRPGDSVVEVGGGWGALARHMARHYGVCVRVFNTCHEQVVYARQRALAEGLGDRAFFIEDDYRNIAGRHDAFVSVGLLEHATPLHDGEFGQVIDRCLTRSGRGLIHTVGRRRAREFLPRIAPPVTSRFLPATPPPTLRQMMDRFEPCDLALLDVENLRLHQARTFAHWRERFEQHHEQIAQRFDDWLVRAWRLHLAESAAAFSTGWLQLFQVVFARHDHNALHPKPRGVE